MPCHPCSDRSLEDYLYARREAEANGCDCSSAGESVDPCFSPRSCECLCSRSQSTLCPVNQPVKTISHSPNLTASILSSTVPLLIVPSPSSPPSPPWTPLYLSTHLPDPLSFSHAPSHSPNSPNPFTFHAFDQNYPLSSLFPEDDGPQYSRARVSLAHALDGALSPPFYAKLPPSGLSPALISELAPLTGASADFDIWLGTRHWRTHTHYDFQHNFYHQLFGEKKFVLLPPASGALFPHLHPRYRQTLSVHEVGMEVTLKPGESLYIPPLWLHTAETASDWSVSAAICTASLQEAIADGLEMDFGVPIEEEWGEGRRVWALRRFYQALDADSGALIEVANRYKLLGLGLGLGGAVEEEEGGEEDLAHIVGRAKEIRAFLDDSKVDARSRQLLLANYFENVAEFLLPLRVAVGLLSTPTSECLP